ncbi:glutamate-gated chloride channel [Folsomia candida]|uniref:glutamate-gated chloride channel n=1 Tax=Folsomia candida TaxID=158441 RepID=UPI00160555C6|nr:glutamate-gated chloride channel [Folsomia candida]XP_035716282.1 glutamate-gated chloride channel [Folsomia candida]
MFVIKVAFILLFASSLATQASTTTYSVKDNVIIEKILQSYDGNMRPSGENGSSPTVVSVNFYIRSIPELDDVKMVYKTQLTFRMQWLDEGPKFESTDAHRYITLPATTLGKTLW